jgi:hypothetical protein
MTTPQRYERLSRTAYGQYLQTVSFYNVPYNDTPFTTLNEKLNIFPDEKVPAGKYPVPKYWAYGNKGHKPEIGADGIGIIDFYHHDVTDGAFYRQMPFVLRTIDNDLPPEVRAKYGLRCVETYDNVKYFAYYLRRLDMTTFIPRMYMRTVNNGVSTLQPFVPDSSNLSPIPSQLAPTGVNETNGASIVTLGTLTMSLDANETQELLNVASIIYKNDKYAIVSEVGLVAGHERLVNVTTPGQGEITYNEVIQAQVVAFLATHASAYTQNTGLEFSFITGASDAVIDITVVP